MTSVELHVPIYVAQQRYQTDDNNRISFDKGDEMKLIEKINNNNELNVQHLRTGRTGLVLKTLVKLDRQTPLRLAINDRAIANRCLEQYDTLGAYFIRSSRHNPMDFVLSISQINLERNASFWHYLICIDPTSHTYYFFNEERLRSFHFSSFNRLINDQLVRQVIPLTVVLPYRIVFDDTLWRIPFHQLSIGKKIGEGAFADVFQTVWQKHRTSQIVAAKRIKIQDLTDTITHEIEVLKALTHPYIVSLHGVTHDPVHNRIYLITEFMENGDLRSWLQSLSRLPNDSVILRIAKQITMGMCFLEAREYVHRDLACRNILVGSRANTVKIADFGLSTIMNNLDNRRQQEVQAQKLPFRWSAPELLLNSAAYSSKSDVWSFGILLIEIWLKGEIPYENKIAAYVRSTVLSGNIHAKPADCPMKFYLSIICQCLQYDVHRRLSFQKLRLLLEQWQW
jgi:tRNA A-37 threonylcarbamoyl transferase component Bud32